MPETAKVDVSLGAPVAERERVGYRFGVRNPAGLFELEQQVCIGERDGRVLWMRSLRPVEGE